MYIMYATTGRLFARLAFPLLTAALFFLAGCSGDDAPTSPSETWSNNSVKFDVEWKDGAVRFDSTDMNDLVSIDTAQQIFTFRSSNAKVDDLQAGSVIVVNDYTIRRVTNVSASGGNTVVRTSAAALTDAVNKADIKWDYGVEFKAEPIIKALRKDGASVTQVTVDSLKFEIKIGAYGYKGEMKLYGDSASVKLFVEKLLGGVKVAEFSLVGMMKRFRSTGVVKIENGQLKEFKTENNNARGEFVLKATVAGSGNDLNIKVPLTLVKYPIAGLPFFTVDIKALVVMNSVVPPDGSTLLEVKFTYDADQGLQYDAASTKVLPIFNLKKKDFEKMRDPRTGASSPIAVSVGMALPRYELVLFNTTLAWFHLAYLIGGDYTPHFPPCQQAKASFIGACGWGLGALGGAVLTGEKTLWQVDKVLLKTGECP